jgi:hypothetical protein
MITKIKILQKCEQHVRTKRLWLVLFIALSCDTEDIAPILSFGGQGRVEMVEGSLSSVVSSYGPALVLNNAAPTDITVYLTTSGTAKVNEDFTFVNPVVITKGSTLSSLDLQFIDDKLDEPDEEAVFKVERIVGGIVSIDTAAARILILDNDNADLRISLLWAIGGNTGSDNIDMDLYLWRETSPGSGQFELVEKQANHNATSGVEGIQLSGLSPDGLYGISYVYYQGKTDNFTFRCILESVGSAILEGGKSQIEFNPTYNKVNLNTGTVSIREQFFTKKGFEFKNVTAVTVPANGS